METHEGPFGIEFIKIPSGICEIGTDKGGWIYASERPKYRASLPAYSIMKAPITLQQAAEIFDEKSLKATFYSTMSIIRLFMRSAELFPKNLILKYVLPVMLNGK